MDSEHLIKRVRFDKSAKKDATVKADDSSSSSDEEENEQRRLKQARLKAAYKRAYTDDEYKDKMSILDDPCVTRFFEVTVLVFFLLLGVYSYFYYEDVMHKIHLVYAHLGHAEAQHIVAQRYLKGIGGVPKDEREAIKWMKEAADAGHAEASYNLGVAHMKRVTQLKKGEARRLIHHAARNGVKQADFVHKEICVKTGRCDT